MIYVATSGCFDVLHPGHFDLLRVARSYGDHLTVFMNDDASIRRLKGKDRPAYTLAARLMALKELRCVDRVFIFAEDTPCEAMARTKIDIYIKEAEYKGKKIPEEPIMAEKGGRIVFYPRSVLTSTSDILVKGLGS